MLKNYLPAYYKKSKVMADILDAQETECIQFGSEVKEIGDTFFVILANKYIDRHTSDLGLPTQSGNPGSTDGVEAKRARIIARLRGLATMTPSAVENIINTYSYGLVRVTEYSSQYMFKIRFINEKGTPVLIDKIMEVIEEIKPAHLAVDYVFTYRVWQEVRSAFTTWAGVRQNTWEFIRTFEFLEKCLHISNDGRVYYCPDGCGNARLEWLDGGAYAVRDEKRILHIDKNGKVYLCLYGEGKSELKWENNRAYAVRLEE